MAQPTEPNTPWWTFLTGHVSAAVIQRTWLHAGELRKLVLLFLTRCRNSRWPQQLFPSYDRREGRMVLPGGLRPACWLPPQHLGLGQASHLVGALPQVNIPQPHSWTGHRSFCLELAGDSVLAIRYKSMSGQQCKQFTSSAYQEVWV